jgi:cytochrome c nitrite reductase small subunit
MAIPNEGATMPTGVTRVALPVALLTAALGVAAGLGGVAFVHGKGTSYLTNNSAACANCHVMQAHYDGWLKSSHHAVATCNDCHTPASPLGKGFVKAVNGARHSIAFTLGDFPDSLRARPQDIKVLEQQCRYCHADMLLAMPDGGEELRCVRCHNTVGHQL